MEIKQASSPGPAVGIPVPLDYFHNFFFLMSSFYFGQVVLAFRLW